MLAHFLRRWIILKELAPTAFKNRECQFEEQLLGEFLDNDAVCSKDSGMTSFESEDHR